MSHELSRAMFFFEALPAHWHPITHFWSKPSTRGPSAPFLPSKSHEDRSKYEGSGTFRKISQILLSAHATGTNSGKDCIRVCNNRADAAHWTRAPSVSSMIGGRGIEKDLFSCSFRYTTVPRQDSQWRTLLPTYLCVAEAAELKISTIGWYWMAALSLGLTLGPYLCRSELPIRFRTVL